MQQNQLVSYIITAVIVILVVVLRMRRLGRSRPLKLEQLWILPVIYAVIAAGLLIESPPDAAGAFWCAAALVVGAAIGWWRGRLIAIGIDPATDQLNQQASPAALIFLVALIAVRYALRTVAVSEAVNWHVSPATLVDALLMLGLGVIAVQRLEMFLRARRLLAQGRAGR